ncbi:hypothetical protein SAMN04883147_11212, partial [Streptomyces sp. DpondAA-F4]
PVPGGGTASGDGPASGRRGPGSRRPHPEPPSRHRPPRGPRRPRGTRRRAPRETHRPVPASGGTSPRRAPGRYERPWARPCVNCPPAPCRPSADRAPVRPVPGPVRRSGRARRCPYCTGRPRGLSFFGCGRDSGSGSASWTGAALVDAGGGGRPAALLGSFRTAALLGSFRTAAFLRPHRAARHHPRHPVRAPGRARGPVTCARGDRRPLGGAAPHGRVRTPGARVRTAARHRPSGAAPDGPGGRSRPGSA